MVGFVGLNSTNFYKAGGQVESAAIRSAFYLFFVPSLDFEIFWVA